MADTHVPFSVNLNALNPLLSRRRQFLDAWRGVCHADLGQTLELDDNDFDGIFERELAQLGEPGKTSDEDALDAVFQSTAAMLSRRGVTLASLLAVSACSGRAAQMALGNELGPETLRALSELEAARARAYARAYQAAEAPKRGRCGPPLISLRRAPENLDADAQQYGVIGVSDAMRRVRGAIYVASRGPKQHILLLGEHGTGRTLVARAIHEAAGGDRSHFAVVSADGLPNDMIESELFGRAKNGSPEYFGLFQAADGGTLFIDELADVPPEIQAKLVRVLEDRQVLPVGAANRVNVDVRVVGATRYDPAELVAQGKLRPDLYQRLRTFSIKLPPLRERPEDVPLLVEHILTTFCHRRCGCIWGVSERAMDALKAADWPGNVRELRNAIEHAVSTGDGGVIELGDLPENLHALSKTDGRGGKAALSDLPSLRDAETQLIRATLEHFRGNKVRAAMSLGISRHKLYDRLRKLGIQ